jgi:ArpU family phage transcriptional regulator
MNWKAEAKEKLRRYEAMRLVTVNIPLELERLEVDAQSIRSARSDATPVSGGGNRREEAMINNIIERQELERALQQAKLWLRSTDRALTALTKEEQLILHRLYLYPEKGSVTLLSKELGIESSSIYRHRDKALLHFTLAYYGIA